MRCTPQSQQPFCLNSNLCIFVWYYISIPAEKDNGDEADHDNDGNEDDEDNRLLVVPTLKFQSHRNFCLEIKDWIFVAQWLYEYR